MVIKHRLVTIAVSAIVVAAGGVLAQPPGTEAGRTATEHGSLDGYVLVWADEFNKDGPPDPNNWIYERGFVRNEELQWYQSDNAICRDGLLVIEARRERQPNPSYDPNSNHWRRSRQYAEYTSSCLKTTGLHAWTYGRFEMRGRIDTRPGLWPAFWTLGSARPWPGCGEIDIMEYYRGMLLANACWAGQRRGATVWDDLRKPLTEFGDPDWSSKFHVWRMDWDKDSIKLYVDDQLLNTIDLSRTINGTPDKANPFHEPHYILLNLAIGGTSGGDPSQTPFPARFEIDYVRIYQKAPQQ
ncbi:MAG: glycoside hydrolase family 16 protein [Planctomycetes bacterium]|nr:glycoside hydrolase family 16 protein [Planctomycetota bacterium]